VQKLMGFFRYDQFPFVIGLEIEKFDDNGRAYVHQVGWYRPDQIVTIRPVKPGRVIKEAISNLATEHSRRQRDVTDEMRKKVEELLGGPVKR
jgi:hypothetical protein